MNLSCVLLGFLLPSKRQQHLNFLVYISDLLFIGSPPTGVSFASRYRYVLTVVLVVVQLTRTFQIVIPRAFTNIEVAPDRMSGCFCGPAHEPTITASRIC